MVFDEDEWKKELRESRRETKKTLWSGIGMALVFLWMLCYSVFK